MFLKTLQQKSAEKALNKKLAALRTKEISKKPVKSIGVIVNADLFSESDKLIRELETIANVTLMRYQKKKLTETVSEEAVFSDKDFGWKGKAKTATLQKFLDTSFDLLISYYNGDSLPLTLVSGLQKANFKIGIAGTHQEIHDMIIQTQKEDISTFTKELKTYLHILNKLA